MRALLTRVGTALVIALALALAMGPIGTGPRSAGSNDLDAATAVPSVPTIWAGSDDISIDEIDRVKRGKENVQLRADVGRSGMVCQFKVKYADGNADKLDDVESDKKGICETRFDVPNRKSVVGDAVVKLKVEMKKGSDEGKASRGFTVTDRRGS